jgi:UDP-N-acetylmuramyl pentapeptide phosphotransferase/UDP-N-acetylglucosamine-1-phosphate transferase
VPHAVFAPLVAFAAALIAVWWLARSRLARIAVDRPNERSLHDKPVPRIGGLGLHTGTLLAWPVIGLEFPAILWISFVGLLIVSLIDDIRGLPVLARLAAHLLASGSIAAFIIFPDHGWIAACIATLGLTWISNLYNFMDGADGLAGGMAFFGFGVYGIAAWHAGSTAFAMFNFSVAAAAVAFLLFNFHPARIFMGDVGAVPLGFLAGSMGLIGWLRQDWAWWFPLLVFSPFVVDASITLARRAFRGARIWEAHRDHCYQRLVRMGWGHRRTALAEYALMMLCGIAALAGLRWTQTGQITLLLAAVLVYIVIIGFVEIAWRRYNGGNRHEA